MAVEILRPNATGSSTELEVIPIATPHWAAVDEETPDDETTTVNPSTTSYSRDLYNLPASSGSGTINKITVFFRCKALGTNPKAKASIKSNTTVTDGAEKSFAEYNTWYDFSQEWALNPADSEAWEWADIDALQIGVSLIAAVKETVYCTQVYVEVDYTPPVAGIGSGGLAAAAKLLLG